MDNLVFAVFDTKAGYYRQPFILRSKGEAIRAFIDICNDSKTELGRYPQDFVLFYLGKFDSDKGVFINNVAPESLGVGTEFISKKGDVDNVQIIK